MKKIMGLLLSFSLVLQACDDTFDYLTPPSIWLTNSDSIEGERNTLLVDSVKNTLKGQLLRKSYTFILSGQTNSIANEFWVDYSIAGGKGSLEMPNREIPNQLGAYSQETAQSLTFILSETSAEYTIVFTPLNRWVTGSPVTLKLIAFENLLPVASFSVSKGTQYGALTLDVDGSKCYDRDAKYDGKIETWEFTLKKVGDATTIGTVRFYSAKHSQPIPESGEYQVTACCYDNDGAKSNVQTFTITF